MVMIFVMPMSRLALLSQVIGARLARRAGHHTVYLTFRESSRRRRH
jgi:hypothetical protein